MRALKNWGRPARGMGRWIQILWVCMVVFAGSGIAFGSSGGEHGEAAGPKGWVATDTYRVMNFAVLAVGLFFVLRKPLSQALSDRTKGIREQLQELEDKKKAAEQELLQYDQKLARLEKEAQEIIERYKHQGEESKQKILKEAEAAADKLQEQARRSMEFELKEAAAQIQNEILEKALAKAESMIRGKIQPDDQDRLIDEYLKKVEAK